MSKYMIACTELRKHGYNPFDLSLKELNEKLGEINSFLHNRNKEEPMSDDEYVKITRRNNKHRFARKYYPCYDQGEITYPEKPTFFWVGVKSGDSYSSPVARYQTSCYSPRPVFYINDIMCFKGCDEITYKVPEQELWAVQEYK